MIADNWTFNTPEELNDLSIYTGWNQTYTDGNTDSFRGN
jgi:hypothetical protein